MFWEVCGIAISNIQTIFISVMFTGEIWDHLLEHLKPSAKHLHGIKSTLILKWWRSCVIIWLAIPLYVYIFMQFLWCHWMVMYNLQHHGENENSIGYKRFEAIQHFGNIDHVSNSCEYNILWRTWYIAWYMRNYQSWLLQCAMCTLLRITCSIPTGWSSTVTTCLNECSLFLF